MKNAGADIKTGPASHDPLTELMLNVRTKPEQYALFFDIDGTLIDLADTPDSIIVPADLPRHLAALSRHLKGALALVTGRALTYADHLFAPHSLLIAGLHGTELRLPDGTFTRPEPTHAFQALKHELTALEKHLPGVLVEDKGAAVAVHIRHVPEAANEIEKTMQAAVVKAGPGYVLQRGKMVFEIRPDSADKGRALNAYMAMPPFAGRVPVAWGDDVTDESLFAAANRLGGVSIRVGAPAPTEAIHRMNSPHVVRDMLATLVQGKPDDEQGRFR